MLANKRILLIIGGGIAAYKTPDLIRRLRERGARVTPVLTRAGSEFVTPLTVAAVAGERVHDQLFDLTTEAEMGHIQLSRSADLIVVAPATADLMSKMAGGERCFAEGPLSGKRVVVTSGPTHEPIDPVRYIANRSSGAQGTAIARALAALGAEVVFVTGPASVPPPEGVQVVKVETAREMKEAVEAALPADAAIFAAAVADWRVRSASGSKIKKVKGTLPTLEFDENPDILATVSQMETGRPALVVGFAAETDDVVAHATAKRARKGCDWILANDVRPETGIMGGAENAVVLISEQGAEDWPRMGKEAVAEKLAARVAEALRQGR